jgi:PAS domain S-box-containing protein
MANAFSSRRVMQSLRFRLPLFLTLYSGVVGLVLFTVANEVQEAAFERDFERTELVRATEIQSRTERAAERNELETAQREFGELAVFEEIRAAVFVAPDNQVVLSSRRDWIGRPVDLSALGLAAVERPRLEEAMERARARGRTESLFSLDRDLLTFVMPATVPIGPGELSATRGALILLVHDLSLSKAINRGRLLRQFGVGAVAVFLAVVGLGISLQALVTRRIERLHHAMGRFAAGGPRVRDDVRAHGAPGLGHDEIAELHRHFNDIAATVGREITVRRQTEDALRESEERFRSAMQHSPIGMALVSLSRQYVEVNSAFCAIVGYGAEELRSMRIEDVTHPDDRAADRVAIERMLKREVEKIRRVKRYRHPDGRIRWVQVNSSLVLDDKGSPRYFVSQIQDITERKRADEELQHANDRYGRQEAALTKLTRSRVGGAGELTDIVREVTEIVAGTLSVALVGVWRLDESGRTARCQDLMQWPAADHEEGMTLGAETCPAFFRALAGAEVLAVTDALSDPRTTELAAQLLTPNGVTSIMCVPIRSGGATVGFLSCRHIGEPRRWMPDEQAFALTVANLLSTLIAQADRQRLEEQLRQAQKLEAIGRLAGGIAHDFNNILTVILGRSEEVSADDRLPQDLRESVADLSQNALRATALTRQLLAFSRRQTIEVRDVDLNGVVANVTRLLHRVLGEDIVVTFTYSEQQLAVRADAGMLEQVLLNLAVNARDAMPAGGRLTIDTALASAVGPDGSPATWARLRVADTGIGIAPEHLPHIFEPFFTTKDVGKGTGLGLATTYGIVQQHGGWIEVDSNVGRGTEFRVYFPAVLVQPPATTPASGPLPAPRGRETILVVEDEAGVRALVISLLEGLGYRLLQAQSGPHALEVWKDHGDEVELLITDIVMPDGMNGVQLAEHLRRERPGLKVIFTSGYLADLSREDVSHHSDAFIAKPFSLADLAKLVRRTLDGGEPVATAVTRGA